jgi:predicted nuclease of predicted toxin-antitoxin system
MRLLLDQGLPRSTVRHLAGMGVVAEHVGDLGLARAADTHILDVARERHAAVVTLDADFHALLATSHADCPSVVRIRVEGLNGEQLSSLLTQVLAVASMEIEAGAVVSVTARRIRVRMLPIGR